MKRCLFSFKTEKTSFHSMNLDDFDIMKLAMRHRIPIQGCKADLYHALRRIGKIYKIFVKYFLWKLGGPYIEPVNSEDYFTGSDISSVSPYYLFSIVEHGKQYHFDIRSITDTNVYTTCPFDEHTRARYLRKVRWLERFGFPTIYSSRAKTVDQYAVDVFQLVNRYQYCDIEWFTSLSFDQLVNLYDKIADIWIYRAELDATEKRNIVKGGIVFTNTVNSYESNMIEKLRHQLLRNIERLVTEGITEDHRRTGALYVMLGLVQVSEDASAFHPNLFQAAYYMP